LKNDHLICRFCCFHIHVNVELDLIDQNYVVSVIILQLQPNSNYIG